MPLQHILIHRCCPPPWVRAEAARRTLPLGMFPLLAGGDLWAIYSELRSIHLRTLNKERAEIIAQHWLREGRVPSPRQVRKKGWGVGGVGGWVGWWGGVGGGGGRMAGCGRAGR